jgi:transaldolase
MRAESLKVKLFADGADLQVMKEMANKPFIQGLTTNPTLMRKSGVANYEQFALKVLSEIKDKPISFEVFSDDFDEMRDQAIRISSWARNVNVKIPITNSKGESSEKLIRELSKEGVALNITALMTTKQVETVISAADQSVPIYISVFAGRIADTGRNPIPIMEESIKILRSNPKAELIWASPREFLNVIQANEIGCHIITATTDILKKIELIGKNLEEYSLETVQMFRNDALSSGFTI